MIPTFLQVYLPSYDIKKLDKKSPQVAREIITSVLNLGDSKAVYWVFDNYTIDQIRNAVEYPNKGVWGEESLNYWCEILKISSKPSHKSAILDIYPV
ncbi:MAG: hypothetical protein Q8L28_00925 [bacterium]|nr:hypothetical protein [bacterium]